MYNPRKALEMMVNDLINKNKINNDKINSVQKFFDYIKITSSKKSEIKISRDQYYRYIRSEGNSNLKKDSLEYIYKYFEINHPDIYNKYIGKAFEKSISEINFFKAKGECTFCCRISEYLFYLSNINDKSKVGVSPAKSDDFPVEIYLCKGCLKSKNSLLIASYSDLIEMFSKIIGVSYLSNKIGVSSSTINRIKSKRINVIDKVVCEKIYRFFRFIEEKDRPMQMAIDFFIGKTTAIEVSEMLDIFCGLKESAEEFIYKEKKYFAKDDYGWSFYKFDDHVGNPSLLSVTMDCSADGIPSATFSLELNASWDYFHNITQDSGGAVHYFLFEIKVDNRMDLGEVVKLEVDGKEIKLA